MLTYSVPARLLPYVKALLPVSIPHAPKNRSPKLTFNQLAKAFNSYFKQTTPHFLRRYAMGAN